MGEGPAPLLQLIRCGGETVQLDALMVLAVLPKHLSHSRVDDFRERIRQFSPDVDYQDAACNPHLQNVGQKLLLLDPGVLGGRVVHAQLTDC